MGKALYRKYRSRSLDEIVGQEHVTSLLQRALERGRVAHAYLFTGPRGTGKTSIARIMAHAINDLPYSDESTHLDIIEIDAASNNGVDDIRDLRDKVQFAPTQAKKKVYIIDEVHMLSKPAFNALLKTLEEPPEHVVFILATTDVEKLPETIISRTQRHTFRRATNDELIQNMQRIATSEGITITPDALHVIAEHSDGGYRDSVSLLDQLANSVGKDETIKAAHIEQSLGLAPTQVITQLLDATQRGDIASIIENLKQLESKGVQAKTISQQIIRFIRTHASDVPQLLPLMSELIEVGQSSLPSAKLLAVLGSFVGVVPSPSLSRSNTKPMSESGSKRVASGGAAPASEEISDFSEDGADQMTGPAYSDLRGDSSIEESVNDGSGDNSAATEEKTVSGDGGSGDSKKKSKKALKNITLNWQSFLEDARKASVGIYTVLTKCGYEHDGATLTIYTKNEFYKKKLDNPKSLGILQSMLQNQAEVDWEVSLIGGSKPPADSQAAAIAAMMGGGEEVQLDE